MRVTACLLASSWRRNYVDCITLKALPLILKKRRKHHLRTQHNAIVMSKKEKHSLGKALFRRSKSFNLTVIAFFSNNQKRERKVSSAL